ncbi:MAG: FAD-binding oxidoreductase, partial [Alkalibacterium sp.]|nr:FAD-binding oxidoreductase [Alkalibacterium sp.]
KKNWALRDNILLGLTKFTEFELLDEVVPINKFAELIEATKAMQEKHGLNVLNFGHAGDGNVHTLLMKDDLTEEAWTKKRAALLKDLYHKVDTLGGLPSAEHGIGIVKKEYMDNMTQTINLEYMRQIKKIFDPENRLNPDKIF